MTRLETATTPRRGVLEVRVIGTEDFEVVPDIADAGWEQRDGMMMSV